MHFLCEQRTSRKQPHRSNKNEQQLNSKTTRVPKTCKTHQTSIGGDNHKPIEKTKNNLIKTNNSKKHIKTTERATHKTQPNASHTFKTNEQFSHN